MPLLHFRFAPALPPRDPHDQVLASWSKAIDLFNSNLTKDETKKVDLTRFPRAEFMDFLSAANTAKESVERKRHTWRKSLQNVFWHINRYAVVGDIIVQHHAEYTSLVWGAFRFLLLFAVEEHNSSEELSKALETIIQIVFRAEEYAKLFSTPSTSSTDRVFESLHENLVRLFAEVLNFLIRTTRFFEKTTLSRFASAGMSPFSTKFQSILNRIEDYERNVEKNKSLLESEARKTQREYENGVWLEHADFETHLHELQQVHISGTCQWFLKSQLYLEWRDSILNFSAISSGTSNFLWIQGKPGCGKSVLASEIIRDLHSSGGSIALYVFCKHDDEGKNTLKSILRNLVFEMMEWSPLKEAFHRLVLNARLSEKSQYAQSIEFLWNIFTEMIGKTDVVHCIIDGLDECQSSESERASFLSRLTKIFNQRISGAKLAVISQLHLSESENHSNFWTKYFIEPSSIQDDIELLATTQIERSKVLKIHPEKDSLLEKLVLRSNGMILWTELMIKELEAGHWNIQNVLEKPPEGLFEMWRSILQRISHARFGTEKLSRTLQLVLAAARPLSHEELALGLAVAQGLRRHEDYDTRGDATAEGRLVVQELSPLLTSMQDNTVQLSHSSLKDYLFYQGAPPISRYFNFNEQDVHAQMSTVLIDYMSFLSFQATLTEQLRPKYFLLEYATRWLVYHSTRTGISTRVAERLVIFFGSVQGWKWLQRLSDVYGISFGQLQLLQSDMASWAPSSCFNDQSVYRVSNFLLILAQNRYETMKSLPNDDPSLLDSMDNLGTTFDHLGRWKEAVELQMQVVEIRKRVLGIEHPKTLDSMHSLALNFHHQARYKESEKLNMQILEIGTRVLGVEHPNTLNSMHNLALDFHEQARYKESEKLNTQILEISRRVLGVGHPKTLDSMHNLALDFHQQARYEESEKLNMQVLEISTRVLGVEHPNTLSSMHNLALDFHEQARYKESEKLNMQILEIKTRVLGVEHPNTLSSMHILAMDFHTQARYKESEKLNTQILEIRTKVQGAEHPHTLTTMSNLAWNYRELGRRNDAIELLEKVVDLRSKTIGPDHPLTLRSISRLNAWSST
ncbi:hypothetical protein MMC22_001530 [Lobaria immixta]|nr:hypothetical protein [Lobaria immixta]